MSKKSMLGKKLTAGALALMMAVTTFSGTAPISTQASSSSDNGDGTYNNPVLYSDVPDQDVIRVGDTYYMVSTAMHLSPGAPIMKSKDLVNWEIVNYVYDTLGENDLTTLTNGQNMYGKGSWAASFRYDTYEGDANPYGNRYYVTFSSYTTGKTYFFTTTDIENGPWTHTEVDHVYHDMGLLFDDDGKVYLAHGGGNIKIVEMERVENGLAVVGNERDLIDNVWKGTDLENNMNFLRGEGTHLQKINDVYYAFVISWPPADESAGTEPMRTAVCFRADSLDEFAAGNWERQIVLSDKGAAQGGIVDTTDGRWYGMVFRDMGPVGRCPVLVPVTWDKDGYEGWPMMGDENGEVDDTATIPITGMPETSIVVSDEFDYAATEQVAGSTSTLPTTELAAGTDIIINGDFSSEDTSSWYEKETVTLEVVQEGDNKVLKASGRQSTGAGPQQDVSGRIQPGTTYAVSVKVKYSGENHPDAKGFNVTFGDGDWTTFKTMASADVTNGEWTTLTGTFTTPDAFTSNTQTVFVESAWVEKPTADHDWMDFCIDDFSMVVQKEEEPVVNLVTNGDFTTGNTDGWTGREGATIAIAQDGDNNVLKISGRTSTGSGAEQDVTRVMNPGTTYDISLKVKYTGDAHPSTHGFNICFDDGGWPQLYNMGSVTATNGEWATLTGTYTTPDTYVGTSQKIYVETSWNGTPDANEDLMDFYLDDIVITEKAAAADVVAVDYVKGASPLAMEWQWNHNPDNGKWNLTGSALRLTTGSLASNLYEARNMLSQRTYGPTSAGYVSLNTSAMKNGDVAGISAYAAKYGYIGVKMENNKKYLVQVNTKQDETTDPEDYIPYEVERIELTQDNVYLKTEVNFNTNKTDFYYSLNERSWVKLGETLDMVYSLVHFMGYRFGLFNYATTTTGGSVDFDYFRVKDELTGAEQIEKPLNTDAVAKLIGNSNPVVDYQYQADPFAMVYDGRVYLYMSSDAYEYDDNGTLINNSYMRCLKNVRVISSDDMVNWTDHGYVKIAPNAVEGDAVAPWAGGSWAPAAAYKNIDGEDKFFLYFANGAQGISVLQADSPVGPFEDVLGHALIDRGENNPEAAEGVWWLFDPAVFVDDDGSAYLYYGGGITGDDDATQDVKNNPNTARVVKLGDDMISIDKEAGIKVIEAPGIMEDSGMHKFGDKYYYSYCTNYNHTLDEGKSDTDEDYLGRGTICYMVSDDPMGPFTDAKRIFKNPLDFFGVFSNNHHTIFEFNGKYYMTYHAETLGKALDMGVTGYRSTHIDEITVNEDGSIDMMTATYEGVSQLKNLDPYQITEAETIAWQDGIEMAWCDEASATGLAVNREVSSINKNDWISVAGADFGTEGAKTFTVKAAPVAETGGTIELRTDGPTGTLVGSVEVTGTVGEYQEYSCEVTGLTGVQNLFMVFTGTEKIDELMTLDSWKFTQTTTGELPYVDVTDADPNYAWFGEGIQSMYELGIMGGYDPTHFAPYDNITRADFAVTLYRMEGEPDVTSENEFPDVEDGLYYSDAITWASEVGVVTGMKDGTFHPNDKITRQDMVVMLYRYAEEPADKATGDYSSFVDANQIYGYASDAIKWAIAEGLLKGNANGTLSPQKNITRAEIAVILDRFMA